MELEKRFEPFHHRAARRLIANYLSSPTFLKATHRSEALLNLNRGWWNSRGRDSGSSRKHPPSRHFPNTLEKGINAQITALH